MNINILNEKEQYPKLELKSRREYDNDTLEKNSIWEKNIDSLCVEDVWNTSLITNTLNDLIADYKVTHFLDSQISSEQKSDKNEQEELSGFPTFQDELDPDEIVENFFANYYYENEEDIENDIDGTVLSKKRTYYEMSEKPHSIKTKENLIKNENTEQKEKKINETDYDQEMIEVDTNEPEGNKNNSEPQMKRQRVKETEKIDSADQYGKYYPFVPPEDRPKPPELPQELSQNEELEQFVLSWYYAGFYQGYEKAYNRYNNTNFK